MPADLSEGSFDGPSDPEPAWAAILEGASVVVNLAAEVSHLASWSVVLRDNIRTTWNLLEAAARYRVPRVVFASSHRVTIGREREWVAAGASNAPRIGLDDSPSPSSPYGLSKACGEMAGRMFVEQGRLRSFIAVRIGAFHAVRPEEPDGRRI